MRAGAHHARGVFNPARGLFRTYESQASSQLRAQARNDRVPVKGPTSPVQAPPPSRLQAMSPYDPWRTFTWRGDAASKTKGLVRTWLDHPFGGGGGGVGLIERIQAMIFQRSSEPMAVIGPFTVPSPKRW
jgi:hypothetical protein